MPFDSANVVNREGSFKGAPAPSAPQGGRGSALRLCARTKSPLTRFTPLIGAGLVRVAWQPLRPKSKACQEVAIY